MTLPKVLAEETVGQRHFQYGPSTVLKGIWFAICNDRPTCVGIGMDQSSAKRDLVRQLRDFVRGKAGKPGVKRVRTKISVFPQ